MSFTFTEKEERDVFKPQSVEKILDELGEFDRFYDGDYEPDELLAHYDKLIRGSFPLSEEELSKFSLTNFPDMYEALQLSAELYTHVQLQQTSRGGSVNTAEMQAMRRRMEEMEDEIEQLQDDKRALEQAQQTILNKEQIINSLKNNEKELKSQLQAAQKRVATVENQLLNRGDSHERLNDELDDLKDRYEALQLEAAVSLKKLEEALLENARLNKEEEVLAHGLEQASADYENTKVMLLEADEVIQSLSKDKTLLEMQVEDLRAKLEAGSELDQFAQSVNKQFQEWQSVLRAKEEKIMEQEKEMERLEQERKTLELELSNLSQDGLQKRLHEKDQIIAELRDNESKHQEDIELLTKELLMTEQRVKERVEQALEAPEKRQKKAEEELEEALGRLEDLKRRNDVTQSNLMSKESELNELRDLVAQLQRGESGLEQLMFKLKEQRFQMSKRDADIQTLSRQLNEANARSQRMGYENRAMRLKLGIDAKDEIDISQAQFQDQVEVQQLKYHNSFLENEVKKLEDQMSKLRAENRVLSRQRGAIAALKEFSGDKQFVLDQFDLGDLTREEMEAQKEERARREAAGESTLGGSSSMMGMGGGGGGDAAGFKREFTILTGEVQKMGGLLEKSELEKQKLRNTVEAHKATIEDQREEIRRLKRQLQDVLREVQGTVPSTPGKQGSTPDLTKILSNLENDGGAANKLRALRKELQQLKDDQATLQMERDAAVKRATSMEGELRVLRDGGGANTVPAAAAGTVTAEQAQLMQSQMMAMQMQMMGMANQTGVGGDGSGDGSHGNGNGNGTMAMTGAGMVMTHGIPLPRALQEGRLEDMAGLNEQLIECLDALAEKEKELVRVESRMGEYKRAVHKAKDTQTLLFNEHLTAKANWERQRKALHVQLRQFQEEAEVNRVSMEEAEKLQRSLGSSRDEQERRLGEMTRRLTLARINEKTASRKAQALEESIRDVREENHRLKSELMDVETMFHRRLADLEETTKEREERLRRANEDLNRSVSQSKYDAAWHDFQSMADKYARLLDRERQLVDQLATREQNDTDLRLANARIERLEADLDQEHKKVVRLQETQALLEKSQQGGGAGSVEASKLVELSNAAMAAQEAEGNARSRLRLLEKRLESAEAHETSLTQRLRELEVRNQELLESHQRAESAHDEMRRQYSGAMSRREGERLQERARELEGTNGTLRARVTRLEAQVAQADERQLEMVRRLELEYDRQARLEEALRKMQGESEEMAQLGSQAERLVHLQLQQGELQAQVDTYKRLDARAQATERELQRRLAEKERELLEADERARKRYDMVHNELTEYKQRAAGSLSLDKAEAFRGTIEKLGRAKRAMESKLDEIKEEKNEIQDELWKAQVEAKEVRAAVAAIEMGQMDQKVMDLTQAMVEVRLENNQLKRRVREMHEREVYLNTVQHENEALLRQLEEAQLRKEAKEDYRELEYRHRVTTLEQQLEEAEKAKQVLEIDLKQARQHGGGGDPGMRSSSLSSSMVTMTTTTTTNTSSGTRTPSTYHTDTSKSLKEQLELALAQIDRKQSLVDDQHRQIEILKSSNETLQTQLSVSNNELYEQRQQVQDLRLKLATGGASGHGGDVGDVMGRHDDKRAIAVAQQQIESLQNLLERKTEEVSKYQKLLSAAQETAAVADARSVSQWKEAEAEAQGRALKHLVDMLERMGHERTTMSEVTAHGVQHEVESLLRDKDQRIDQLNAEVVALRKELERSVEVMRLKAAEVDEDQSQLSRLRLELRTAEESNGKLARALDAAQRKLEQAPSENVLELIGHMKRQLEVKEKQQRLLNEAIQGLREELVEALHMQASMGGGGGGGSGGIGSTPRRSAHRSAILDTPSGRGQREEEAGMTSEMLKQAQEEIREMEREMQELQARIKFLEANKQSLEKENKALSHSARTQSSSSSSSKKEAAEERRKMKADLLKMDELLKESNEKEIRLEKQIAEMQERARVNPEAVKLRKRLSALQQKLAAKTGELDEAKAQIASLEAQLNEAQRDAGSSSSSSSSSNDGGGGQQQGQSSSDDSTAGGNSSQSSTNKSTSSATTRKAWEGSDNPEVQRWEHEKKMQRKQEALRKKLAERSDEVEALKKQVGQFRDTLERVEAERERTDAQLKELQATTGTKKSVAKAIQAMETVHELKDRILELERANSDLKRVVEVEATNEKRALERTVARLRKQLAEARRDMENVESAAAAFARGASSSSAEEGVLQELKARNTEKEVTIQELEGQLVKAESAALELRFDRENQAMLNAKLEEKVQELETFRAVVSDTFELHNISEKGVKKRMAKAKSQKELEKVVDALKRVIDKLQSENDALRKTSKSNVKYMELVKEAKALRAKNTELSAQLDASREKVDAYDQLERTMRTMSDQSAGLRRQVKAAHKEVAKAKRELEAALAERDEAKAELARADDAVSAAEEAGQMHFERTRALLEGQVRDMERELRAAKAESEKRRVAAKDAKKELGAAKKALDAREMELEEVKQAYATLAASTQQSDAGALQRQLAELMPIVEALQAKKEELARENKSLREELGAFDEQFFEEVEDLRVGFAKSKKEVERLEAELARVKGESEPKAAP